MGDEYKSEAHAQLAALAPSIVIATYWALDPYFRWDGDGPDPEDSGYSAYDVEVRATCIVHGIFVTGSAHLGGSYSKPGEHDPDVHGYFLQMAEEALLDLPPSAERDAAVQWLREEMRRRYDKQREEHTQGIYGRT